MAGDIRAEWIKIVRRPAVWLLLAVAVTLSLTFTYLIPYAGLSGQTAIGADRGLASMLPDRLVGNSVAGLPVFLGALMVIFGVLVVGGEYAWGTWKTVLTAQPRRLRLYAAKLAVLAAGATATGGVLFVVGASTSAVVAAAQDQPMTWPPVGDLAVGLGAGALLGTMWAVGGAALAVALRGVALPIGLGLVWMLAVQNLLAAVAAPLLPAVATVQKGLPGPNAGSLAAALGTNPVTPGVEALVGGGQAALVVAGYLVGFAVCGAVLLHRRDIL